MAEDNRNIMPFGLPLRPDAHGPSSSREKTGDCEASNPSGKTQNFPKKKYQGEPFVSGNRMPPVDHQYPGAHRDIRRSFVITDQNETGCP